MSKRRSASVLLDRCWTARTASSTGELAEERGDRRALCVQWATAGPSGQAQNMMEAGGESIGWYELPVIVDPREASTAYQVVSCICLRSSDAVVQAGRESRSAVESYAAPGGSVRIIECVLATTRTRSGRAHYGRRRDEQAAIGISRAMLCNRLTRPARREGTDEDSHHARRAHVSDSLGIWPD